MANRIWLTVRSALVVAAAFLVFGCSEINKSQAENRAMANISEADRQLTLGHEAEARTWLDRGVAWNPDAISTYLGPESDSDGQAGAIGLIGCLYSHYDWPAMASYLAKAVSNPKISGNWLVWQYLALAQDQLGQSGASEQSSRRELDILNGVGQPKGAEIVALDSDDLLLDRAGAEWGAGQHDQARADFERFIARYPQSAAEAENDLAYNDAVANVDLPNAYALAKAAVGTVRRDPDTSDDTVGAYVDTLGWVEYRMGMYKQAARDAEEAISESPREPEIHYHLASIYQALGDEADAKIEIDRSAALCPSDAATQAALRVIDPTDPGTGTL